jgi:hypothetical protein
MTLSLDQVNEAMMLRRSLKFTFLNHVSDVWGLRGDIKRDRGVGDLVTSCMLLLVIGKGHSWIKRCRYVEHTHNYVDVHYSCSTSRCVWRLIQGSQHRKNCLYSIKGHQHHFTSGKVSCTPDDCAEENPLSRLLLPAIVQQDRRS